MGQKAKTRFDYELLHDEVTGSCFKCRYINPNKVTNFAVDCGLFQEKAYLERNNKLPFDAKELSYVFLTHIHADHCARLPMLYHNGYKGNVYTTHISKELLPITLSNSYYLLSNESKKNHTPLLYTEEDLKTTYKNTLGFEYNKFIKLDEYISVMFLGNGHLLGAACIYLKLSYPGEKDINVLFTGDYSSKNRFFNVIEIPDEILEEPVTVIQEATYGYMKSSEIEYILEENVKRAVKQNKTIVFPAFAIGRYQEIVYLVNTWKKRGVVPKRYKIYLDGVMPFEYNEKYLKFASFLKPEMRKFIPDDAIRVVSNMDSTKNKTKQKSKGKKKSKKQKIVLRESVIKSTKPKIIISTSGMGSHGSSYEYITSMRYRNDVLFHFLGYLAEGTLGRALQDEEEYGRKNPNCEDVPFEHAETKFTKELSTHDKQDQQLKFLKKFKKINCLSINHGNFTAVNKYYDYVKTHSTIKNIQILNSRTVYRIGPYGFIKSFTKETN